MTLSTWKTEFYPTEASECSKEDAIEHSLRKWRGLRKEALERHGLYFDTYDYVVVDDDGGYHFTVDASSCALCEHFLAEESDSWDEDRCKACPLSKSRSGISCDDTMNSEKSSPWHAWLDKTDPEPMIAALEKAQKEQP